MGTERDWEQWPDLYIRVQLPDGRQGALRGYMSPGSLIGGATIARILTDDYHDVSVRLTEVTEIKRSRGTVAYTDGSNHARIYPVERDNLAKLHRAVMHDHWRRHPPDADQVWGREHIESWLRGEVQELPPREDLTQIVVGRPLQLRFAW